MDLPKVLFLKPAVGQNTALHGATKALFLKPAVGQNIALHGATKALFLKPAVGQNTALHAFPNEAILSLNISAVLLHCLFVYTNPQHSDGFFPNPLQTDCCQSPTVNQTFTCVLA